MLINQRKSSNCDRCILNLVHQHLMQTDENSSTFNEEQQKLTQLKQVFDQLGAIMVTSEGQVQFMTQRGAKQSQSPVNLRVENDVIKEIYVF